VYHDDYDAVVYDLDGTLVHLPVDWNQAASDAAAALVDVGVDADGMDLWKMLDVAEERGHLDVLEAVLSDHECRGAERAERLPTADDVAAADVPVGVCSLNAERACRVALDRHDLAPHVATVVGRDSLPTHKPDPEPLLTTVDRLGADPDRSLFVGDTERDAVTADRAGVAFRYVDGASP
jgi:phosphoglycolate phosphatase